MNITTNRFRRAGMNTVLMLSGLCSLVAVLSTNAQEVISPDLGKREIISSPQGRSTVRSGYTRPGNPSDIIRPDGSLAPLAFGEIKGKIIGGTVYFAVFDRMPGGEDSAVGGDSWGSGLPDLDQRFVPGKNFTGNRSPGLDTKSRYLYLYQIVNDRGTIEPRKDGVGLSLDPKRQPARAEEIASFTLKLMVDPRYITSWGHFRGAGFNASVSKLDWKQLQDGMFLGMVGADTSRLAISADPAVQASLPSAAYTRFAPSNDLGRLGRGFGVGDATTGLSGTSTAALFADARRKGALSAWSIYLSAMAQGAREPEFVQVRSLSGDGSVVPGGLGGAGIEQGETPDGPAPAIFRADWMRGQYIAGGGHSSVFGFTTDLPPADMPVRIDDADAAGASGDGAGAGAGGGAGSSVGVAGPGMAPGSAPSPRVPVAQPVVGPLPSGNAMIAGSPSGLAPSGIVSGAVGGGGGALGGIMGGGTIGGGVGSFGSFPTTGGAGGLGFARPPFVFAGTVSGGGGGGGGGSGSGTGSGGGTGTGTGAGNGSTTINFSASLVNQQAQSQSSNSSSASASTSTSSATSTSTSTTTPGQVIPEPASLLLGAIGLPGLYFLWRRRSTKPEEAAKE